MNVKRIKMLIAFIGLSVASVFAEATATLYLIRPASFLSGMIGKNVYVDVAGAQIGNLPNKKYIKLEIPANVEIEVGAYTTGLASIARKFMPIILDEGKTCYMQLTFTAEAIGTTNRYSSVMNKNVSQTQYNYDLQWSEVGSSMGKRILKKTKEKEAEDLDFLAKQLELKKIENLSQHLADQDIKSLFSDMRAIRQEQSNLKEEQTTINKQYEEISKVTAKDMPAPTVESEVDVNIPISTKKAENNYALIIANENYEFVDNVDYALHDGEIFKEYCIKTLGIPEKQVLYARNATSGMMNGEVEKLVKLANIDEGANIIVYYCGHGIPDENTNEAYLIPVDGKGANIVTCYSLNKLYSTLSATKAANITYFLDACFTGSNREGSMLVAARGVAREAKKEVLNGNTVVFAAASQDETAMAYKEKTHGMFTYFLLKKLQDTKGDVTYGELAEYIKKNVQKESILVNDKSQSPNIATSVAVTESWSNMTLK
jgi:hypothetical protein